MKYVLTVVPPSDQMVVKTTLKLDAKPPRHMAEIITGKSQTRRRDTAFFLIMKLPFFSYIDATKESACMRFVHCTAVIVLIIFSICSGQAQNQIETDLRLINKVLACDESVTLQDVIVSEAIRKLNADAVLFVVVRLGNGENVSLTRRRLSDVDKFFERNLSRLVPNKRMAVLGPKIAGNGRLEFYINGELYLGLLYPKNGYICHS